MLTIFKQVFYTESILLLRHSREWLYPLCFFLIVICLFPLAFTPDNAFLIKWMPGCIWIAALFANVLAMQTVFMTDIEDGHLEQCLLTATPLSLLVFAKLAAHWLITAFPLVVLAPILAWLFGLKWMTACALGLSLLLGTPIITLLGSLGVALTIGLRQKGMMLGLLIFPLVTPVLIFGVAMVTQTQHDFSIAGPVAFLAGVCLLAVLLLPLVIAEALRVGVDD